MLYKFAVKTYFIFLICLIVILPITVYISDPYMLFHKHWFHHGQMCSNMRIQDYGLIKYGKFNGIIIGTSMLENTSANEATAKLGTRFANLSVSGSSFYERFKILDMALKTKKIEHIIMSLDYKFSQLQEVNDTFEPDLYSSFSFKGKLAVYSTDKALKCVFLNRSCSLVNFDLDRPAAWYNNSFHSRRFGGFENWLKFAKEDEQIQDAFKLLRTTQNNYDADIGLYQQIMDMEILPLFNKYQSTKFSIIIPPYSALYWAKRKNSLPLLLKPYQYLLEKTAHMPNVKIYWFYDEDYVFDIAKYKDLTHYHYAINSLQLDAIQNNSHLLTLDNYKAKFNRFMQKINDFDLQFYINKIPAS